MLAKSLQAEPDAYVMPVFRGFESRADAADALATVLSKRLAEAIEANGRASLVASGGSSPEATYQRLSACALDWSRVKVLPSDERCVPADSARNNLAMIRRSLGVDAEFIELNECAQISSLLPFDVVLLGMGEDGHTASLFPSDPDIDAALASESRVIQCRPPDAEESRISLTPRALLDAGAICLLILGSGKRARYEAARQPGCSAEYPVRILFQQRRVPVQVFWAP